MSSAAAGPSATGTSISCSRLDDAGMLRALVGQHVARADAVQTKGFIGDGKIAIGGVEVMIRLVDRLVAAGLPVLEMLFDGHEVCDRELHFDFQHGVSPCSAPAVTAF